MRPKNFLAYIVRICVINFTRMIHDFLLDTKNNDNSSWIILAAKYFFACNYI